MPHIFTYLLSRKDLFNKMVSDPFLAYDLRVMKLIKESIKQRHYCLGLLKSLSERDGTGQAFSEAIETINNSGFMHPANHIFADYTPTLEITAENDDFEYSDIESDTDDAILETPKKSLNDIEQEVQKRVVASGKNPEDQNARDWHQTAVFEEFDLEHNHIFDEQQKIVDNLESDDDETGSFILVENGEDLNKTAELKIELEKEEMMRDFDSFNPGRNPRQDDFRNLIEPTTIDKQDHTLISQIKDLSTKKDEVNELKTLLFQANIEEEKKIKEKVNRRGERMMMDVDELFFDESEDDFELFGEGLLGSRNFVIDDEDIRGEEEGRLVQANKYQQRLKARESVISLVNVFANVGVARNGEEIIVQSRLPDVKEQVSEEENNQKKGEISKEPFPGRRQDSEKGQVSQVESPQSRNNNISVKSSSKGNSPNKKSNLVKTVKASEYMKQIPFMRTKKKALRGEVIEYGTTSLFEKKPTNYVYESVTGEEAIEASTKMTKTSSKKKKTNKKNKKNLTVTRKNKKLFGVELEKFDLAEVRQSEPKMVRIELDFNEMVEEEEDDDVLKQMWELRKEGLVSIMRQPGQVTFEYTNKAQNVVFTRNGFVSMEDMIEAANEQHTSEHSNLDFDIYERKIWAMNKEKNDDPVDLNYYSPVKIQLQHEKFRQMADSVDGLIAPNLDTKRRLAKPNQPSFQDYNPTDKWDRFLDVEAVVGDELMDPRLKESYIRKEIHEEIDASSNRRVKDILEEKEMEDLRYVAQEDWEKVLGVEKAKLFKQRIEEAGGTWITGQGIKEYLGPEALDVEKQEIARRKDFNKQMLNELSDNRRILKEDSERNEKRNLFDKGKSNMTTAEIEHLEETEDIQEQFQEMNKDRDFEEDIPSPFEVDFQMDYFMELTEKTVDDLYQKDNQGEALLQSKLDNKLLIDYSELGSHLKVKLLEETTTPWLERYIKENMMEEGTLNSKMFLEGFPIRKLVFEEETVDTRMWGIISGESTKVSKLKEIGIELSPYLEHLMENQAFVGEGNEYEIYHLEEEIENDKGFLDNVLHPVNEIELQKRNEAFKLEKKKAQTIEKIKEERILNQIMNGEKIEKEGSPKRFDQLVDERLTKISIKDKKRIQKMDDPHEVFKELIGFDYNASELELDEEERKEYVSKEITDDMEGWVKARIVFKIRTLEDIERDVAIGRRSYRINSPDIMTWDLVRRVMGRITEGNKKQVPDVLADLIDEGWIKPYDLPPVEIYVRQFEELMDKMDTDKVSPSFHNYTNTSDLKQN